METFWTIIPFITPLLIILIVYKRSKNKEKVQKISWLEKQSFYKYVKLVFFTRVKYRPWTMLLHFSFWISILLFYITINIYISTPAVPLTQMKVLEGNVREIYLNKKSSDILVLHISNGTEKMLATSMNKQERQSLLGKKIKIWYFNVYNMFHFEDTIYQIYINNKPLNKHWAYSYAIHVENKKKMMSFIIRVLFIAFLSAFFLWFFNKQELPIHRFNRIKNNKKLRGE